MFGVSAEAMLTRPISATARAATRGSQRDVGAVDGLKKYGRRSRLPGAGPIPSAVVAPWSGVQILITAAEADGYAVGSAVGSAADLARAAVRAAPRRRSEAPRGSSSVSAS